MPHIVSTLSNDQNYTDWSKPDQIGKVARPAVLRKQIIIKGKANIITKSLVTPEGVLTSVTEDELEILKKIPLFQKHIDGGHLKIIVREASADKIAKDMTDRDSSAPLNEAKGDFKKGGRAAGVAPKSSKIE